MVILVCPFIWLSPEVLRKKQIDSTHPWIYLTEIWTKSHWTMEFMVLEGSAISKMVRRKEKQEDWEKADRSVEQRLEGLMDGLSDSRTGRLEWQRASARTECLSQWFWSRAGGAGERVQGESEGMNVWGSAEEKTVRVEEVKTLCGQGLQRFDYTDTETSQKVTTILVPIHTGVKENDQKVRG